MRVVIIETALGGGLVALISCPIVLTYDGIPHVIAVLIINRYLQVCVYLFISAGHESYAGISFGDRSGNIGYRVMDCVFNADVVVCTGIDDHCGTVGGVRFYDGFDNHCGTVGGVSGSAGDGEVGDGEFYAV